MSVRRAEHVSLAFAAVASMCLAMVTCFVSANLAGRHEHLGDVIAQQFEILHGQPLTWAGAPSDVWELHNRILVPIVLAASSHVMTPEHAFLVIRLASAWLMFLAFVRLIGGPRSSALLGAAFLFYVLLISFAHPYEHPFDFPDVLFTIVFVWATLHERRGWLLVAVAVATINRESSAFAGVLWWCTYRQRGSRDVLFAAGLSAGAYALALWVRSIFSIPGPLRNRITFFSIPRVLMDTLHEMTLFAWPVLILLTVVPVVWWVWDLRAALSWQERRLVVAGVLMGGITLGFGVPWEPRVLLPVWTVLICAATSAHSRLTDGGGRAFSE